ncbi:unnamed protein product [Adineta ricciae]|uniref:Uncharacterized protein n=1 Tax=Adineta ricciae TaxID=249248 RepID=A0A813TM14_ADIRI|nr:unnamed protein product [Adineta ricciae]CAF0820147.1 unnamed protein product [Adineta ricciae]
MEAQSSNEAGQKEGEEEKSSGNSDDEQLLTEESTSDDRVQRKRSRFISHPEEEIDHKRDNEQTNDNISEETKASSKNHDKLLDDKVTSTKRRRLNIDSTEVTDEERKTSNSIQTTNTTKNETKDEVSATASTTTDDDNDDDDDDDDEEEEEDEDEDEDEDDEIKNDNNQEDNTNEEENLPPTVNRHLYLRQRELGIFHRPRQRTTSRVFHENIIASRNIVQRMKVSHSLDAHNGCVNALSFNRIGTLLASASDDLQIVVWEWTRPQIAAMFDSHHRSNVFQAKFVPLSCDYKIVSCARDGEVRLAELHSSGTLSSTKKIAQHLSSAHKLSVDTTTGTDIFSCGEDGVVYHIDLRDNKPNKLLTVSNERTNKLPLYSIELNRNHQNEFVVAGMDPHIRLFDRRYIEPQANKPLKSFCPDVLKKIEDRRSQPSVTCAVYNHNGTEILGSYNDEDIYLFDATHSDGADAIHHYQGHRNNNTVKGVNFYGRNSEYIISGSDCGHVFMWDKPTEKCAWYAKGDDDGTVNVLEPHPCFPIIATSGLDHDVKIWAPLNHNSVDYKRLKMIMKRNARDRQRELQFPNMFDSDPTSFLRLMRPVFRRMARRANAEGEETDDEDDDDDDDDDDEDGDEDENDEDGPRHGRHIHSFDCAPS